MVKNRNSSPWLKAMVGLVVVTAVVSITASAASAQAGDVYPGVTRPSEERALSFSYPGVVREVFVKEGERVKVGQPLLKLDDRLDRNALEQLLIEANSPLKIDYAAKSREQKEVRAKRLRELRESDMASVLEVEESELNAELAVTQLKLSYEEQQTAKLKAEGQALKVELATRTSTIDGIVQSINVKEGEYSDPQQSQRPAVMVVKLDPLRVEVFLPLAVARPLSTGTQFLEVAYADANEWKRAEVTFVDPLSDPGSGMRRVRLELANPENRPAGEQVRVRLPSN